MSYFAGDRLRKRKTTTIIISTIIAIVAAVAAVALTYKPAPVLAVSAVECHSGKMQEYHIYSHLAVFVNGQEQ